MQSSFPIIKLELESFILTQWYILPLRNFTIKHAKNKINIKENNNSYARFVKDITNVVNYNLNPLNLTPNFKILKPLINN